MTNRAYTKSRLFKELAYKVGVKKVLSQKILDALAEIIYREAANGGFVLPGVCKFDVVERKARRLRNPRTGEVLVLPAHKTLRATLSNIAKRKVAPRPQTITLEEYERTLKPVADVATAAAVEAVSAEAAEPEVSTEPVPAPVVAESEPAENAPAAIEPVSEEAPAASVAAEPTPAAEAAPETKPAPAESAPAEDVSVPAGDPAAEPAPAESAPVSTENVAAESPQSEEAPAAPAEEPPAPAEEPSAETSAEGAVSFRCPGCGQEIEAPAEAIGMEAECPMCGRIVVVPKTSEPGTMYGPATDGGTKASGEVVTAEEAEEMEPDALKNRTIRIDTTLFGFDDEDSGASRAEDAPPAADEKMISFFCKKCHQEIEATADMSGSQGECPNCGASFVVPYFSDPGSIHDDSAAKLREQQKIQAQKHSTMRINLDEF